MIGYAIFAMFAAVILAGALWAAGTVWTIPYLVFMTVAVVIFDRWITRHDRRPTR